MVMAHSSKYKTIYNHIGAMTCSSDQLMRLKLKYADAINSKRRWETISNLAQLLHVLEKRDVLNPDKIEVFTFISSQFGDFTLRTLISQYNNNNTNFVPPQNNNILQQEPPVFPQVSIDVRDRVYDCIASDIGQKWVEFARALGIREGEIDNLNGIRHLSDRVHRILRYHEQICDQRLWRTNLLEALSNARRNDLRREVQNIFDIF